MWEFPQRIWRCISPVKNGKDETFLKVSGIYRGDRSRQLREKHFENRPVAKSLLVRIEGAAPLGPNPVPVANVVGAVLKRNCTDTGVNRKFLRGLKQYTANWCRKRLRPLTADTDLSLETWLEGTKYSSVRKQQLRKVMSDNEDLVGMARRARPGQRYPRRLRQAVRVKSFIKDEFYPSIKYPRCINSREDWFKAFSGPLFAEIGRQVGKEKEFIKYVPVADRMQTIWERLHTPGGTYFSSDYSSFESHFTEKLMKNCEFVMYKHMVKKLGVEQRMNMDFICSTLSGENRLSFKDLNVLLQAVRMSGEMNTSLGNGFANLMIMKFSCHLKDCGKIRIFVEGDDAILWIERPGNAPTISDFEYWGFIIKLESSQHLNELSFCGQVFDPFEGIVITDPVDALLNFGWSSKKYIECNYLTLRQLTLAAAYSMAYQYNGCPMLSAFARKLVALLKGVTVRRSIVFNMNLYDREEYLQVEQLGLPRELRPGVGTRALFAKLYGISVASQLLFEEKITRELELGDSIEILCDGWVYNDEQVSNVERIVDGWQRMITAPTPEYLCYLESVLPHNKEKGREILWPDFYSKKDLGFPRPYEGMRQPIHYY